MAKNKCKACHSVDVRRFLSFGKLPLGNAFLNPNQVKSEKKFDLDLGFCSACKLVQQISPPPQSSLTRVYQNYRYVPVGGSLRGNLANLSRAIVEEFNLKPDSFFIDIGSNDGALLSGVKDRCKTLGIEPAIEISELARKAGVETLTSFFTPDLAKRLVSDRGRADVVTATQVLQHIPDLEEFVKSVQMLLKPTGIFVVEGRYFADTVRKFSFDTVYHEMLYFFTLTSLANFFRTIGMEIFRAELVDVYGGSLRVYAKSKENRDIPINESVSRILGIERDLGLEKFQTYSSFAEKVFELRDELHSLILKLSAKGRIAGYGAPSTGTTLLNFCKIGKGEVEYIVDDSPLKQGLLTPGVHIPIVDSTVLTQRPPDYLLIIAWRMKDEILPKIKESQKRGMSIIIPLPKIEIISWDKTNDLPKSLVLNA
jgi:SAM-dependent methyltransferase